MRGRRRGLFRRCRRLDCCGGRRNHNYGAGGRNGARRSLGNHCACGRMRGDGRCSCGWGNDGRSRTRLRNNPARGRMRGRWRRRNWGCSCRRCGSRHCGRPGRRGRSGFSWRGRWRLHGQTLVTRLFFLFLLFGQNGLHHIAGLGDVREVDLGDDGLPGVAGRCCARRVSRGLRVLPKTRANLLGFVRLERAGVRLDASHAEFRK